MHDDNNEEVVKAFYKALVVLFREISIQPHVLSVAKYRAQIRSILDAQYVDIHHQHTASDGGGGDDAKPVKME